MTPKCEETMLKKEILSSPEKFLLIILVNFKNYSHDQLLIFYQLFDEGLS